MIGTADSGRPRAALLSLFLFALPTAGRAAPQPPDRRIPRLNLPQLPDGFGAEIREVDTEVPSIRAVSERQELVIVGNDNDGKPSSFAIRSDSSGRGTHLEFGPVSEPGNARSLPFGDAFKRCPARGADRLDRRRACGVELEHARGDTSAVRLFGPDLDPVTGGTLILIYLKHYAIFGSHKVGEYHLRLAKVNGDWKLYAASVPGRPIGGLFLHRASRGIGSITACLDRVCPAEWSRRQREQNEGLPPVWSGQAIRRYRYRR